MEVVERVESEGVLMLLRETRRGVRIRGEMENRTQRNERGET